jgi:tRNA splicing ligase
MSIMEIGWKGVDWIRLTQIREQVQALMNTVIKLWVPLNLGSSWQSNYDFLRRALLNEVS